jgi:hypothetical protein
MFSQLRTKILTVSAEEEERRHRANRSVATIFRGRRNSHASSITEQHSAGTGTGTGGATTTDTTNTNITESTSTTNAKKKKKKQPVPLPVNVDRVVLFNFTPDPIHHEQIPVHVNDIVFVYEDCVDGWSIVETKKKLKGVVPTSYIGPITSATAAAVVAESVHNPHNKSTKSETTTDTTTSTSITTSPETNTTSTTSSIMSYFTLNLNQRIDALKSMFIAWLKEKAIVLLHMLFVVVKTLVMDGLIPGMIFMIKLFTLNESYTTIVSSAVRNAFLAGISWIIPNMSDEELDHLIVDVKDFSHTVHEESSKREVAIALFNNAKKTVQQHNNSKNNGGDGIM